MDIPEREDKDFFASSNFVTELTPNDFNSIEVWKLKDGKCSIILFYAPWCPHCQSIKDMWSNLGKTAAFFNVYAFNCEKNKEHISKIRSDLPELIKGYPTIIVYKNKEPIEQVGDIESERSVGNLTKVCMRICKES